ncbi:MAG: MFS transporter [Desulfobacteraceae bacterium]|nr:MFS transporter [Desulfobacteraceae bacterium]
MDKDLTSQRTILTNPHSLFQLEYPILFLQRVLRVYHHEVKLLVWVTLIQLVMSVSSVLINNFAHTTFLKRFGVEYLPVIFLIEAVLTFFFANAVGVLMDRYRTVRVFTGLLVFFALSAGIIRGLLPLQIAFLYPVLYILKSQAIEILPILYWDILSDLFTTRQSKRLYTLIIAGGVLGTTLGSLITGPVARWVGINNVLLIFVGGMLTAAFLNELTRKVVGAPVEPRFDRRKGKLDGTFKENIKEFISYARRSPLLKFMILIIAIPNMVLPILTYQFNVVVDSTFATEETTIQFFGIFRGVSNAVMFVILMFSGRLVTRWGVATSLIFHPINYLIAFGGLLFRFDFVLALYARFSTEALKTTINNPARAVLYYFFPPEMRGLIRVFLRGTVVRAADFTGSGLLVLVKGLMDPRLLSLIAAPLVLIWILTTTRLKKRYSSLLIESLMEKQIDWERLEDVDFKAWVKDKKTLDSLEQGLNDPNPDIAVTSGEILARVAPPGWTKSIVEALPGKPAKSQKALLDLLKPEGAEQVIESLLKMLEGASTDTLSTLLHTLSRIDPRGSLPIMEALVDHPDLRVRMQALAGLYLSRDSQAEADFRRRIQQLLEGDEPKKRMAIEVLGKTGDPAFAQLLLHLVKDKDTDLKVWALFGLAKMKHGEAIDVALTAIQESSHLVREAALEVLIGNSEKAPLDVWIRLLGDKDPKIREKASTVIQQRGKGVVQGILPALASPSRTVRNEVLAILEGLGAPSAKLSQFMIRELGKAYHYLAYAQALKASEGSNTIPLLTDHLLEKNDEIMEVVLRVLGVMEFKERMDVIIKAIQTGEKRDKENAVEALESSLHPGIRKILIPLLDERPLAEKVAIGQKRLKIDRLIGKPLETILLSLLEDDDPIIHTLSLYVLGEVGEDRIAEDPLLGFLGAKNQMVRQAAHWALHKIKAEPAIQEQPIKGPNIIEKTLCIRKIPIFRNLRIHELLAIAFVTITKCLAKGEILVREGDPGDALHMILDGELALIKGMGTEKERVLERLQKDGFSGELALIDHKPRSEALRAESDTMLLVIKAEDFGKIMENYPAIPISICKIFVQRIRVLHGRLLGSK